MYVLLCLKRKKENMAFIYYKKRERINGISKYQIPEKYKEIMHE